MRRANELLTVAIVLIVTLSAVLGGCTQRDPPSDSEMRSQSGNSAVASSDLPEVVVAAPRPRSKTIVLSQGSRGR